MGMEHELRNFNKTTMQGYCLTCRGLTKITKTENDYYCVKQLTRRAKPVVPVVKTPQRYQNPVYAHGLRRSEADKLKENSVCEICGETTTKKLRIDHCHKTLVIRGILCNDCNLGIGRFKDDPKLLEAAIAYLNKT